VGACPARAQLAHSNTAIAGPAIPVFFAPTKTLVLKVSFIVSRVLRKLDDIAPLADAVDSRHKVALKLPQRGRESNIYPHEEVKYIGSAPNICSSMSPQTRSEIAALKPVKDSAQAPRSSLAS
jgi:hypothetical protein